jgi:succinate dehydrogenase flavin-adding protein (antitoxin of CptAB toxin-antitoxin module)
MQLKIDPSLLKICEANMTEIKKGNFSTALKHADNYLFYVTNGNQPKITWELKEFRNYLGQLQKSA